jgi:hypothetical protein
MDEMDAQIFEWGVEAGRLHRALDAALARAEAAETTLRTIRWHMEPHDPRMATEADIVNLLREFAQVTEAMYEAQEKAEAAERRVAELEALLAGWVALKRGAIERREDIPWQALLVEFREPTAAERAYGETLISLLPPPTGENSR